MRYRTTKHLILVKIQGMMNIKKVLLQWSINYLIKNLLVQLLRLQILSNKELAEELHKLIIRKFTKRKVHSPFIDNIFGPNLAEMPLISKSNKRIRYLLCVIDIFSKYAQVISLKDKKKYYNN